MGTGLGGMLNYEAGREKKMRNNINRIEYDDLEFRTDPHDNRKTLTGVWCGKICLLEVFLLQCG